ncbi:MAG: hypothetical protein AB7P20_06090 [Rhizobiaceae bacterium]
MQIAYKRIFVLAALAASALSAACVADQGAGTTSGLSPTTSAQTEASATVEEGSATDAGDASEGGSPGTEAAASVQVAAAATLAPPPRSGSPVYRCDGGRTLTIENRRSAVTLLDPDGETMVLPASPVGQQNRYGKKPYALVIEGGEVLYVKPRQPPFTCRR